MQWVSGGFLVLDRLVQVLAGGIRPIIYKQRILIAAAVTRVNKRHVEVVPHTMALQ